MFAMCISVSSFVTTYQVATYHRGNRISNGHRQEHCCAGCRCMGASINKMGASTEVWCAHNISQHTKRSRYGDDVCPKGCSPICQLQYAPVGVGTIVRRRITGAIAITPRSPHTSVSPRCPLRKTGLISTSSSGASEVALPGTDLPVVVENHVYIGNPFTTTDRTHMFAVLVRIDVYCYCSTWLLGCLIGGPTGRWIGSSVGL